MDPKYWNTDSEARHQNLTPRQCAEIAAARHQRTLPTVSMLNRLSAVIIIGSAIVIGYNFTAFLHLFGVL